MSNSSPSPEQLLQNKMHTMFKELEEHQALLREDEIEFIKQNSHLPTLTRRKWRTLHQMHVRLEKLIRDKSNSQT